MKSITRLAPIAGLAALAIGTPVVASAATSPTPKTGKWSGSTQIVIEGVNPVGVPFNVKQTVPVNFSVTSGGKGVKTFTLDKFKVLCANKKVLATSGYPANMSSVKPKIGSTAKFKFTHTVFSRTVKVSGRFVSKTQAVGTIAFTYTGGGTTCPALDKDDSSTLKWSAKLK